MTRRYLPNLIAALVAAVGIVIGSIGPWVTVLGIDRTNTDGDGIITLVLGAAAAAMLFAVFNLGSDRAKLQTRLCTVCIPSVRSPSWSRRPTWARSPPATLSCSGRPSPHSPAGVSGWCCSCRWCWS